MRTGGASCLAEESQAISLDKFVADTHVYFRHVHINGEEALPVIDDDAVALVEKAAREYDCPGVRHDNRGTFAYREVCAAMGAAQLFVENMGHAERVGGLGLYRRDKVARPLGRGQEMRECAGLYQLIGGNFLLAFCVGLHKIFRHVDCSSRERACCKFYCF